MGFYGNSLSSAKTNLQIDKHYSNRKAMEEECSRDGVYAGRYVLIEYDLDTHLNQLYFDNTTGYCYWDTTHINKYKNNGSDNGILYRVFKDNIADIWVGDSTQSIGIRKASTVEIERNKYFSNYSKDQKAYQNIGQGYDSTVWQKIYEDGVPTYVNIASLNSVIPTFKLTVDAPTEKPISPYFDGTSTNILYNLHVQPAWGLKVNKINFNEEGFNKEVSNIVEDDNNYINFTKGRSGNKYGIDKIIQDDILELNLNLPAIGNIAAKGYDLIYGEDRTGNSFTSLQGIKNFFTETLKSDEIPLRATDKLIGAKLKGDSWIAAQINNNSKQIEITHQAAGNIATTVGQTENENPQFNESFSIPYIKYDEKGHIKESGTRNITLPNNAILNTQQLTITSKNTNPETLTGTVNDILINLLSRIVALENPDNSVVS